jgi:hypothetical protein
MATEPQVIVHAANAKPELPPVGMLFHNREKGFYEQWNGKAWVPYVPAQDAAK